MSAPQLIKAHGCRNCGHSAVQKGQLVCAANPPTAAPISRVDEEGQISVVGWASSFPPVAPDLKCGQWKMRLAVATAVEKASV